MVVGRMSAAGCPSILRLDDCPAVVSEDNGEVSTAPRREHLPDSAPPCRARFTLAGWRCALSALLFLDHICMAQAAQDIQAELHLTNLELSYVLMALRLRTDCSKPGTSGNTSVGGWSPVNDAVPEIGTNECVPGSLELVRVASSLIMGSL